jgi:hypothetical protein
MERLQITTLTAQNISNALLVSTYVATADKELLVQVYISGVAGDGTYRVCLSKQLLGVGITYQSPTTGVALAATVTTAFLPSIVMPVKNTDVLKIYIQGLAADTSVGVVVEVFDVQSGLATATALTTVDDAVWAYAVRTLTQAAAMVASAVQGSTLTCQRGDTFTAVLTGLGNISSRSKLWFTVKLNDEDADTAALVQIEETAGLLYLNGAIAGTAANGDIPIDNATLGNIRILLEAPETDDLRQCTAKYDVQMLTSAGVVTTLTSGIFDVVLDQTRAVA